VSSWTDLYSRSTPSEGELVVLGMSGGVDSTMSAQLLVERGYRLAGVTLKNYCYGEGEEGARACCSLESIEKARSVASTLGFPHRVVDATVPFGEQVIEPFLGEYGRGRTPNPCVRCNARVRFPALLRAAESLGAKRVATGHYARILRDDRGRLALARGVDETKDQSYFLYDLPRDYYARLLLPLGSLRKERVRAMARARGWGAAAAAPESMEVCFLAGRPLADYLSGRVPLEPGNVVDEWGRVLGRHSGTALYTVGQRRGLGVSHPEPLYVLEIRADRNEIVAGPRSRLARCSVRCAPAWMRVEEGENGKELRARIRYRGREVAVERIDRSGDGLEVRLGEPVEGVAAGQALVLYRDQLVVGGGRIETGLVVAGARGGAPTNGESS
jgi:tRNA-specific 2-thiouridylase